MDRTKDYESSSEESVNETTATSKGTRKSKKDSKSKNRQKKQKKRRNSSSSSDREKEKDDPNKLMMLNEDLDTIQKHHFTKNMVEFIKIFVEELNMEREIQNEDPILIWVREKGEDDFKIFVQK